MNRPIYNLVMENNKVCDLSIKICEYIENCSDKELLAAAIRLEKYKEVRFLMEFGQKTYSPKNHTEITMNNSIYYKDIATMRRLLPSFQQPFCNLGWGLEIFYKILTLRNSQCELENIDK